MPRVKFDYVVSFSSEDPDNQANNLLATEISKKKWLCKKGESACSVVLQMTKAIKICAVHIGAYHASFVEVLVGRSEKPSDPFQVLVASSMFLSLVEARKEQSVERVRSFSIDQLSSETRDQHWDRVRIVCSQPHNKHCQFGLSFVHIFESEGSRESFCPMAVPKRMLNLDTFSSDEDEFCPGELFAKYNSQDNINNSSTDVQIRQATSKVLRNPSDYEVKLKKTPMQKNQYLKHLNDEKRDTDYVRRNTDRLLYNNDDDDDEESNERINKVLQRHTDEQKKNNVDKPTAKKERIDEGKETPNIKNKKEKLKATNHNRNSEERSNKTLNLNRDTNKPTSSTTSSDNNETRKRTHSNIKQEVKLLVGPVSDSPHELLAGVVIVLSGYVNPRRAQLRNTALALGAQCRPDWDSTCTHLICAFPKTPKLKQVRASAGGVKVAIVLGEWLERCAATKRLLPWQWYATEDSERLPEQPIDHIQDTKEESECDTDDEIEKFLQKQKKPRLDEIANATRKNTQNDDEGDQPSTEPDTDVDDDVQIEENRALPRFFEGFTFLVNSSQPNLSRYVLAYGGLLLHEDQLDDETEIDFVVADRPVEGVKGARSVVRPSWLWRCHREQLLCDHTK